MGKSITVFKGATGINNKIDPTRLKFDPETGIGELASAVNVDIDDTGRVYRRDGYVLKAAGAYGNLFSMGTYALATKDGFIGILGSDFAFTALASVTPGARVSYMRIGTQVFYMNGFEKGVIEGSVHSPWVAQNYVGTETNKTFEDPPIGHLLAAYNGHMYVAQEASAFHLLHYSHRFAYSWFNYADNYLRFPDRITMLMAVADGLYVGSGGMVYFLAGAIPREFAIREVAECSVYEGSAVKFPAFKVTGPDLQGEAVIWGSPEGVWIGGPGGLTINLTEKNLVLPTGSKSVGYYTGEKYYCMIEQ